MQSAGHAPSLVATLIALPWCCMVIPLLASGATSTSFAMALDRSIGEIVIPFISWPLLLLAHARFWRGLLRARRNNATLRASRVVLNGTLVAVGTGVVGYFSIVQLHGSPLWDAFCGDISAIEVQYLIVKDFFERLL